MIKKIFGEILKKISDSMVTLAPASYWGSGIEEMPESLKNLR